MKRILKKTLFIFMSILLAQNYHAQAYGGPAAKIAAETVKIAAEAVKATPAAVGFIGRCSQTIKEATINYVIKPTWRITKAATLAAAGYGYSQYENGKIVFKDGVLKIPTATPPAEPTQGLWGNIFNWNWRTNTPRVGVGDAGKKIIEEERFFPRLSTMWNVAVDWTTNNFIADYLVKSSPGKWVAANPDKSKVIAAWFVAGFIYEDYYKQRQLEKLNTMMNKGIQDGTAGTTTYGTTWQDCQAILAASGAYPATTPANARAYIDRINHGELTIEQNPWVAAAFYLHPYTIYKKMTRK